MDDKIQIKPETLDFIFEYTKDAPEAQLKDVEALDNKVIQILSISSVIIGLIGFATGGKVVSLSSLWALIFALVAYMAVAVSAFIHLRTSNYRRSLQADMLWHMGWDKDVKDIKHSLVEDISKAYTFNKIAINKKAMTLRAIVIFAALEVIGTGIFIVLEVLTTSPHS